VVTRSASSGRRPRTRCRALRSADSSAIKPSIRCAPDRRSHLRRRGDILSHGWNAGLLYSRPPGAAHRSDRRPTLRIVRCRSEADRLGDGQPQTVTGVTRGRIFDVQNAPWTFRLRLPRGVNDERSHRQDSACRDFAVNRPNLCGKPVNGIIAENASSVRSGQISKRSIFNSRVIKVHAQSEDLGQSVSWSVRVDYAIFNGPRPPAFRFATLAQG
jgi:hypothetical protein